MAPCLTNRSTHVPGQIARGVSMTTPRCVAEYVRPNGGRSGEPKARITGLQVQYSHHVCKRELWFMDRGIDIDRETTNIQRGTHVDETSYSDARSCRL